MSEPQDDHDWKQFSSSTPLNVCTKCQLVRKRNTAADSIYSVDSGWSWFRLSEAAQGSRYVVPPCLENRKELMKSKFYSPVYYGEVDD